MTSSSHLRRGMALVALGFACGTALAEPCPTIVVVEGSEPVREQLVSALVARAISIEPRDGCPATRVSIASRDSGVAVAITDTVGHVSERSLADVSTAASFVETWARSDLDGALLDVRRPVVASADARETPTVLVVKAPPAHNTRALRLTLDAESALGSDGSLWFGVSGDACVRLGPTCVGVSFRLSRDTEVSGDSESMQTARSGIDLGVVLDLPRTHEGWSWTPGVTLGLAFSRSRFSPEYGTAMDNIESDGGALCGGAHIGISKSLVSHWALGIDLAADASLFSPADTTDNEADRLADQPRSFLRGGIALRYEGM